jgi:kinetochore protein Mis13/DSN1
LDKEEAIIKRMRAEDRDWNRIAAKTNDLQALTLEATSLMRDARPPPDMNEASDSFQRLLQLSDRAVTVSSGDIGSAGNFGEVEFEVDLLHQTSHQANQYMHQAQRFLDGIFSSLAADLRSRDGQGDSLPPLDDSDGPDTAALLASAAAGPSRATSNPMNMLRALASADSQQQSAEAVAKAAAVSVAPTASSTRTQAMTPRRTATTATPRRQSVYGRGTSTPGRR